MERTGDENPVHSVDPQYGKHAVVQRTTGQLAIEGLLPTTKMSVGAIRTRSARLTVRVFFNQQMPQARIRNGQIIRTPADPGPALNTLRFGIGNGCFEQNWQVVPPSS